MLKTPDIISDMKEHNIQILSDQTKTKSADNCNLLIPGKKNITPETNCNKIIKNNTSSPNSTKKTQNNSSNNTNSSNSEFDRLLKDLCVSVLKCNNQIKELHTVLRDKETSHSDFKFYSDRLIRLIVEEGLNGLPYNEFNVITPGNCEYKGVKYVSGVCGVSIMRSGEAMEKGLRECCRSIRIGKILIQQNEEGLKSNVVYAKFPSDITSRKILLMYPITTTGTTVNLAIDVLKEHGIVDTNIILLCLFSTPNGLKSIRNKFPGVNILTSEVHHSVPTDFGQRYFGTE